jgi:hypothetical protein
MTYPTNGLTTISANSLKELSTNSGYSIDVIYNKLKKDCKKTDIISISRVMTETAKEKEELNKDKEKKVIDKNRIKIRNNKKYNYEVEIEGVKTKCTKLKEGAILLNIKESFMYKILNNPKFMERYKITMYNI